MNNQTDKQQTSKKPVPPPYPYYPPPQEDEINLFDLWRVLVEQKKLILLFTAISTCVALIYALLATPIYRAEVLLAPVEKEKGGHLGTLAGQFGGLASLAGIDIGGAGSLNEAIATLESRELTNKFIEDENLLQILFEDEWDSKKKKWKNDSDAPTFWDAYEVFHKSIRFVNVDNKTGLISLAIEWKDPVQAAEWANKLVRRVNEKLRQEAIQDSEDSIQYLEAELYKTSILEIKDSIYRLIEVQTKNKMLANTQEEYAFRVLDSAVVPEKKFKPKRALLVIVGFFVGGIIALFSAYIRQAKFA